MTTWKNIPQNLNDHGIGMDENMYSFCVYFNSNQYIFCITYIIYIIYQKK